MLSNGVETMGKKMYTSPDLHRVHLTGGMLADYQKLVKDKAMPYQWAVLNDQVEGAEKSGAIENFRIAAGESKKEYYGTCFQDSDIGKWLEAVAYMLCWSPDAEWESRADDVIELLARAQHPDGYLNTYFTVAEPGGRFQNIRECDELYCFGHLTEAAVAYYEATGKRKMLDVMCRYADLLCDTFGNGEGQIRACDGHPEAEAALVRLYEATGERRYLEQAGFQLETRGSEPYYYDIEWRRRGCTSFHPHLKGERPSDDRGYDQSECLVRELDHPVGHAVKVGYLLSGMAGYSLYTDDRELREACRKIFDRIIHRQMYITGAVGATHHKEAFTKDYHLPNDRAYAETCASVAMIMALRWMLRHGPNSEYADVMERVLYNALPAGMSLNGNRFFYVNPLEVYPRDVEADHDYDSVKMVRQKWFWCACCPPNLVRLFASIGGYLYLHNDEEIYVNLFAQSETELVLGEGRIVHIEQRTAYPWDGRVELRVKGGRGVRLGVRLPGWCESLRFEHNGHALKPAVENGYGLFALQGDEETIVLEMDMRPYYVAADPRVKADAGRVALMRGPVVYCAEECDSGSLLHSVKISPEQNVDMLEERFHGAPVLGVRACGAETAEWKGSLYTRYRPPQKERYLRMIPYAMWGNRLQKEEPAEMQIWLLAKEG